MISSDIDAGERHNDLLRQTRDTQTTIKSMPAGMVAMLRGEHWRRLVRPTDQRIFENATLTDWVLGDPWPGLGFPNWATLYALLEKNPEHGPECTKLLQIQGAPTPHAAELAFAEAHDQVTGHRQGARHDLVDNVNDVGRPTGNATARALRKLRKDHGDLHARVLAGELSPHAAMVQAGFRPRTITVPLDVARLAATLRRHLSIAQIRALAEALSG